jgi:hypothetical protein
MSKRRTIILKDAVQDEEATAYYDSMVDSLIWKSGIQSKTGFTRLAHNVNLDSEFGKEILGLVTEILMEMKKTDPTIPNYAIFGIYINYYKDGKMFTPNHSHKGTHQLVISFGATRTLTLGKRSCRMENGDAILFGSTIHGVPKEDTEDGRISIATFMAPLL